MGYDWRDKASCSGADPELWFPKSGREEAADRAIRICNSCPVREQCLKFAVDNEIDFGIFGGVTARQRYPGRAKPRQYSTVEKTELQPCGTPAAALRHRRRGDPPCDACHYGHGRHPDVAQVLEVTAQLATSDVQSQEEASCA